MNGDGLLNSLDVDAFVAYLTGGQGATGMRAAYAWDAENRLISVTPTAPQAGDKKLVFAYDYLGRRIEKQVFDWDDQAADWQATPSVQRKFVWAGTDAGGWLLLMELDGSDNLVRKYTWGLDLAGQHGSVNSLESAGGIGGLLAAAQAQVGGGSAAGGVDAGEYVFTYDANGNVAQVLDLSAGSAAAAIAAHYEYDPYGGVVNDVSGYTYAEANPIRFSSKYHDAETGLGYWGYRYYNPVLGRWISQDPLGETGGIHLYRYGRNCPMISVDALGLQECGCCGPDVSDWMHVEFSIWFNWINLVNRRIKVWAAQDAPFYEPNIMREKSYHYKFMRLVGPQLTYYPDTAFESASCPSKDCANTVTLCGICIHSSEIGNILYGAIASHFRMSWFQTWGGSIAGNRGKRTEADKASVSIGYDYGEKGGRLCDHVRSLDTKVQKRLGSDAPTACGPCDEKVNHKAHVQLPPVDDTLKDKPPVIGLPPKVVDDRP